MHINVIDACMGSGKTTYMCELMKNWHEEDIHRQILFVSPNLSEVGQGGRIMTACPGLNFKTPTAPPGGTTKMMHLQELLGTTHNITTTHNLFRKLCLSDIQGIQEADNILVIDEALEPVEVFSSTSTGEVGNLISGGQILLDKDTGRLTWDHILFPRTDAETTLLGDLIDLCGAGCLYLWGGHVVMWEYPVEVLRSFTEVYVMTYKFKGSLLSCWCQHHGIDIIQHEPPLMNTSHDMVVQARELITIVDCKALDNVGHYRYSYSGWGSTLNNRTAMRKINTALSEVRKRHTPGVQKKEVLITCPKSALPQISGRGFHNVDWLESDCKATNDYAHKRCLVYLYDKHVNPVFVKYFEKFGIKLDKDLYSLSSMLQWLYRGCIRRGEPMYVVVPCPRMKQLLQEWLK